MTTARQFMQWYVDMFGITEERALSLLDEYFIESNEISYVESPDTELPTRFADDLDELEEFAEWAIRLLENEQKQKEEEKMEMTWKDVAERIGDWAFSVCGMEEARAKDYIRGEIVWNEWTRDLDKAREVAFNAMYEQALDRYWDLAGENQPEEEEEYQEEEEE